MALIRRILLITTWVICCSLYILIVAGMMSPLHEVALSIPQVQNGPFWGSYQRIVWAGTYAVPALLLLSPIVYWIVANVRQESQQYPIPPQP